MAKYKIIPSSRTIVQSPISVGHKAEKGVEAIEFDVTAWVETYGSGTLTVIMRRWGDAIPYPIALEIDENSKATWTLSDTDTAKAGMAYAQLNYIVGDEVVKKSDIYTFRVMDSLTGEGEPPEAYESWLEHLTHLAAEAMAEVLDIEGIVTDKTLTVDGGIADAKATGEALAEKVDAADYSTLSAQVDTNTEDIGGLKADLGDLTELETETKTDLVSAINEAAQSGLSDTVKQALLACFDHVAWDDNNGQTYYDALESALYPQGDLEVISISATYTQNGNVYSDQPLTDLTNDLVVTATYSDETTETIESSDYTLSGTLSGGTSTITVTYGGKTTTFNVNVTAWDTYNYSISNGQISKVTGSTIVMSNYQNDIQLDSSDSTRRSFPTIRGVRPFLDRRNGYAALGYYPIPIPDDAIGAVVTITPATQYHGAAFYTYTNSGGYVKLEGLGLGWEQGSKNYVFANLSSEDIKFITVAGKYDSSGGTYSEEPSELTVEFYKE